MSIASAPEDLAWFDNEENVDHTKNVARSEFEFRGLGRGHRKKKFTEKGNAFLRDLKEKDRDKAFRALKRKLDLIKSLCDAPETELETLVAERNNLDTLKDSFNEAQQAYDTLLNTTSEKEASYHWFDVRDREFTEFRMRVCERIQSLERASYHSEPSVASKSKRSSSSKGSSRVSSRRSVSLARADAAAKAAKCEIEMQFLERESELKRMQIEKQYALARAEERALKEILEEETKFDSVKKEKEPEDVILPYRNVKKEIGEVVDSIAPPIFPKQEPEKSVKKEIHSAEDLIVPHIFPARLKPGIKRCEPEDDLLQPIAPLQNVVRPEDISLTLQQLVRLQTRQTELNSLLINQQRVSHLPVKEPPIFSGDTFEYPSFITAFDSIIAVNVPTDRDRLFYLEKYTRGKANDAIRGFLATNSITAYAEARRLLDHRFGNPEVVAESFKSKLRSWRPINDSDSKGLQEFSDFLVRCEEAMKGMQSMSELDSTQILMSLSAKLPSYSGVKWCRFAHDQRAKGERLIGFKDFAKFVKQEAELANDPVFSPDALKKERRKNIPKDNRNIKPKQLNGISPGHSFATSRAPTQTTKLARSADASSQEESCLVCKGRHPLVKCDTFVKCSADERHETAKSKGLCFRCLRTGHLSSNCVSRSSCGHCGKRHHSLLHGATVKSKTQCEQSGTKPSKSSQQSTECASATDAQSNATSIAHNSASASKNIITCRIIPVILYHKDNPSTEVKTYALLDDASDTTFVTSKVQKELGIKGIDTNLNLSTMHGRQVIEVARIDGLVAERPDRRAQVDLPKAYAKDSIPSRRDQIPTPEIADKWPHLQKIKDKIPKLDEGLDIGLLIGSNCPKAIKPKEVITGKSDDPYAVRTLLGWSIVGPVSSSDAQLDENPRDEDYADGSACNRIIAHEITKGDRGLKFVISEPTKEIVEPTAILKMFELDFGEHKKMEGTSKEDRKFLEIAEKGIRLRNDGHYELPLPLKDRNVRLPNNRETALRRLNHLKKRFDRESSYREDYIAFMTKVIESGYAERVEPVNSETKHVWYIPHHGVYHPKKPNKIRIVFDCAAQYKNESLNKHLLQGPDLTNSLVGVLHRFRQEPVAFTCDIEGMFHQVSVNEEDRDLLRFLWWENGDTSKEAQEFRMTVHLFGATSSPGCANFALKKTASDNEEEFGKETGDFLRNDFYVDDGLKSVRSAERAVKLIQDVKQMCARGGFHLHKFISNDKEVIKSIPEADRSDGAKKLNLDLDSLPLERTLGVQWCIESDSFQFHIVLQDKPCTRRGILSTVSSIFDPLGFVAPLLLHGKSILQELCRRGLGWDDPIPEETKAEWERWRLELTELERISIPRCYKPKGFGRVVKAELHHFSDASVKGYGQCSYLRLEDENMRVHCSFVMGKSRVTPLKPVTIPRLELTAAVCSVRISQQIHQELEYSIDQDYYWTDSKVVLGYIKNESRRFHVFVSNRVQEIQESTTTTQWRYVESKENPADEASRGTKARELPDSRWILGPTFLLEDKRKWETRDEKNHSYVLPQDDPEVKRSVVMATTSSESFPDIDERIQRFSTWYRAKRAIALCVKYVRKLKDRMNKRESDKFQVNVEDLEKAGRLIILSAQARTFQDELKALGQNLPRESEELRNGLKSYSTIYKLDPFIDSVGLLRVGGRLKRADLPYAVKHPVLLPRNSHVSSLIIRHFHERVKHQGKGTTLSEVRSNGFWIVGGSSAVSKAMASCVKCRKLRGPTVEQKMSDLPEDRMKCCPPFTYCAVDYFGPFTIKEGRKELKRYGVLFTCMSSRAVHLETATTLETDSFLNALRRFLSRRGPVRQLRSDQGTNFVGARRELKEALAEMNNENIKTELLKMNCDWINFEMNVPGASHMGGIWERQIRTVRAVLSSLLASNGAQLDDESLRTLMCEAESIVNSRPLAVHQLMDPNSLEPLSPSQLLTMKSKVLMSPPGKFEPADVYSRKRWRRVQHLANEFWTRWRKEFLLSLQERQKWTRAKRNLRIGDIVMVKDGNVPRSAWQLACVATVYPSKDGQVRKVQVALADGHLDDKGRRNNPVRYLERPVQKLVLLVPASEQ